MCTLLAEKHYTLTVEPPNHLEPTLICNHLTLIIILPAFFAPNILKMEKRSRANISLMLLAQDIELNLLHLLLLGSKISLDHLKVRILNLILCQVEIMTVLAIKSDRITTFAVAKGVVADAGPPKYLC